MKTIKLLGELGKQFGTTHKLDISSPAEAIRALCAIFPKFEKWMIESQERGIGFRVLVGKDDVQKLDDIHNPSGEAETIKIVPVLAGAKSEWVSIFVGVALIAASFFIPGGFILTAGNWAYGATYASIAFGIGSALALSGVAQLLTPTPTVQNANSYEAAENKPSYSFDGPVNTTAQGHPVPVGYGKMIVGSAVISAGIYAQDM